MGQPLVYPNNAMMMHVIKMTLSTIVIISVLSPFIYGTIHKLKKQIVYVVYDEFTPCYEDWCINGGIQLGTWGFEIGDGSQYSASQKGWGNNEIQCYTDKYANAHVRPNPEKKGDGMLVISSVFNENATDCKWTSSRLVTKGKKSLKWMRLKHDKFCVSAKVEARIKLSMTSGAWSAFWMLPEPPKGNKTCLGCGVYGGWCNSGEIDIMEHRDTENKVIGNVRYNDTRGCANTPKYSQALDMEQWHVYTLDWTCRHIKLYVDGKLFMTYFPTDKNNKPFDQPFYMILNIAIGGDYPNSKIEETNNKMFVDWIKAYYL